MNLNDFLIYQKLYEEKSTNKDAKVLGYAQSNVTMRLKQIEKEYGAQLFVRTSRGLTPTIAGEKFYTHTNKILIETENIKKALKNKQKASIVTSENLFDYLIVYQERYALAEYDFTIVKTTEINRLADQAQHDIIFSYTELPTTSPYKVIAKGEMNASLMIAIAAEQPNSLPLFVNKDKTCPFRKKSLDEIDTGNPVHEIDSIRNIISLVKASQGIALLPNYLLEQEAGLEKAGTEAYTIEYQIHELL